MITGQEYIVGLALTVGGQAVVSIMGNPAMEPPQVMVAIRGHGLRYWNAMTREGPHCRQGPSSNWHMNRFDFTKLVPNGHAHSSSFGWGSESSTTPIAGVDYPPFLLSRPHTVGSPLPFGPLCAPTEVGCGSLIKYFTVARGDAAGFIQFQQDGLKSWDHAPGILCVQESGGMVVDGNGDDVVFDDRTFSVTKGIVCSAAQANPMIRQRLLACLQETNITSSFY